VNVLQVIPDLSLLTGGPVTALRALVQAQAALGIQTTIGTTDYGIDRAPEIPGVSMQLFPCRWDKWRWSPGLAQFLKDNVHKFDLVSIDSLWRHTTLSAAKMCRIARVPYVIKANGMLEPWSLAQKTWKKKPYLRWIEGSGLQNASALHATSEMEAVSSSMATWNSSVFVLPGAVPCPPLADPNLFLSLFPELADKHILLFLGRLHYKKQPQVLIEAFQLVAARHPEAVLVMVGPCEPRYLRQLQVLARQLGVSSRLLFTGFLPPRIGRSACRAASIFALPSLQENFGVAIAEAMAEECPVVVSNRVGIAPAIDAAAAGLVSSHTAESTASALSILLDDKFMRTRMGQNGRRLVIEEFAVERVAAKLQDVYTDILQKERYSSCWLSDHTTAGPVSDFSVRQWSDSVV
jgi:glycosyltransferase involved in cell wall biosynthesis